jgi:hypothetical protein
MGGARQPVRGLPWMLAAALLGGPAARLDAQAGVTEPLAAPLAFAWGAVAEPAAAGAMSPGSLAEQLEFLHTHGSRAVRARDLAAGTAPAGAVLLTFDDPAAALRFAVPLLELYGAAAVVTVSAAQAEDAALAAVLAELARTPHVELLPRVDAEPAASQPATIGCGGAEPTAASREEETLSRLRRTLESQVARLRALGAAPAGVAWAPGTWSGSAEAVAASLGLGLQLPTFGGMPPQLELPRVARYAVPSWAGIWALVQARAHWDPEHHPVRFLEVDAGWLCGGGDPEARMERLLGAVRRLDLNGVRILPGDRAGVWFTTTAAPSLGDVVGPLTGRLHAAGVRWVMVDLPATGDARRDVALATDLARDADVDVALLPESSTDGDPRAEAARSVRPAIRIGRRADQRLAAGAFEIPASAPAEAPSRGLTVRAATPAGANAEAADRAARGWEWIGLPVELAEDGLRGSLRSLAAFALRDAGEGTPQ